jgi:uncharacterized membrane protein HdeD (DUF308 family)
MKSLIQKAYGTFIFCGLISIIFGILVIAWPGISLLTLAWFFAVPFVLQGISQIVAAIQYRKEDRNWWVMFLLGLINIAAGVIAIIYPALTALFLVLLMGSTWLASGAILIVVALQLRKQIKNEGWLILSGLLAVIAGLFVLLNPGAGALSLIWLIGFYAIAFGIILIIFAARAKAWGKSRFESHAPTVEAG